MGIIREDRAREPEALIYFRDCFSASWFPMTLILGVNISESCTYARSQKKIINREDEPLKNEHSQKSATTTTLEISEPRQTQIISLVCVRLTCVYRRGA